MSVLLKIAGWNLLRAASVRELLAKLAKAGQSALFRSLHRRVRELKTLRQVEFLEIHRLTQCG